MHLDGIDYPVIAWIVSIATLPLVKFGQFDRFVTFFMSAMTLYTLMYVDNIFHWT